MKLSVVIVNYNVEHFLEQCLYSVEKALKQTTGEVWVVDNNSADGSCKMVKEKFPWVKLVESKENLGFSKGNNLAMNQANGEYVLLLNPDTLVEEDTFQKIVNFMDQTPDTGGLGVHMIDGQGKFLPESKRGLPTPSVAFYKIFGLASLFPKSKTFGKYHLGYLSKDKTHEVEILSGAFMLLRKSVLDKIGLLDETFFMYGEDIDLSYRIVKAGFKNYYFADTSIIHYKGESTKKSSVNYVFVFYRAMIIFAEKHFSQKNAKTFSFLINIAIYARAALAIFRRAINVILLPLADILFVYLAFYFSMKLYEKEVLKITHHFPKTFFFWEIPAFIVVWIVSVFLFKGFRKNTTPSSTTKGVIAGTLIIFAFYSMLPSQYKFSVASIFIGSVICLLILLINRLALHFFEFKNFDLGSQRKKRIAVIGEIAEAKRVSRILTISYLKPIYIGMVSPNHEKDENFIGDLSNLKTIVKSFKIDEIIYCAKNLSSSQIIENMAMNASERVDFKIAPPQAHFIIGSHSVNHPGEMYLIDVNSINKKENKKNKRTLDILSSIALLILLPILMFVVNKPLGLIRNILLVLFGQLSWVGYAKIESNQNTLPQIKYGVLNPSDTLRIMPTKSETLEKINLMYAKDYSIYDDIDIMIKGIRLLGRNSAN